MSCGGNKPLCISRGKDVLMVYWHTFRGTPANSPAPCPATLCPKGIRPHRPMACPAPRVTRRAALCVPLALR